MRKFILTACAASLLFFLAPAQSVAPFIINSSGGSFKFPPSNPNSNLHVDWNIGEMTLVSTMQNTSGTLYVLTNGFLQFIHRREYREQSPVTKIVPFSFSEIRVFPNPVQQQVSVDLSLPEGGRVKLTLYNQAGQQLLIRELSVGKEVHLERISMAHYVQGNYLLNVEWWSAEGSATRRGSYKIVKAQ